MKAQLPFLNSSKCLFVGYFALALILLSHMVKAQDVLSRTQIFHAVEWQHPAMAGIQNQLSADVMYRQALNGYGQESGYYQAGVFYPIQKAKTNTGNNTGFKISNATKAREFYNSKKARRIQGVGLQLNAVQLGPLNRTEAKAFYAYHLPVNKKFNLSMGTALKFQQNRVGLGNLTVRDEINDDFYQRLINSSAGAESNMQMDIGMAFYSTDIYFSFTAKSIFNYALRENEYMDYLNDGINYSLLFGYNWKINSDLSLLPNVELNYYSTFGTQYKTAVRLKYKELVYVGVGNHHQLKWSGLVGFNIPGGLFLHYSYDYYTGFIREFANGVHEISLSYLFNNKNSNTPFTW